jgi:cell division protein FtsI (penicillin-binding protein 3)
MGASGTGKEVRGPLTRLAIVAVVLTLWTGAALGRLTYLQLFHYSDYLARARRQQQRIVEISPKRADIFDRNLQELAMSATVDSLFAVPAEIADPDLVARLLAPVLNTSPEEIESRLAGSRSFVWIARKLPPATAARIRALNLRGIYFQQEDERFYPKRQLAAAVLGYVDIDEKGLGGIEYGLDNQIRSKAGRVLILADARSRWYDSSDKRPEAGSSVVLTIDENIQYIVERELAAAIAQTRARSGTVIVQDPSSGEILAMANWPTFNPNAVADVPAEARMNRAIAALYEPGSVFKIVTLSAAIDQGITNPNEVVDCQMGAIYIAGHRIRDHKAYGLLTVAKILANSSDVGAIKIGLRLGAPKLYDYIRAYGFGSPSGIDLPGESRGLLRRLDNWTPVSVGSISMGQEIGVTPIQVVTAMSAIANGGLLYRPHIVQAIRPPKGQENTPQAGDSGLPQAAPVRVIQPTTAAAMRGMLEGVVLEGTGKLARLDGYTTAGKTGTAQKIDPATGRYSSTQLIASFVGFAPINNPVLTVLVQLDSPVGPHDGGAVAAPVFKRIAQQVLAYRNIPRDVPLALTAQNPPRGAKSEIAQADISDFDPVQLSDFVADAPTVSQTTETGAALVNQGTTARANQVASRGASPGVDAPPTAEFADSDGIVVPSLAGKNVREVTEISLKLGFNPVLVGSGLVQAQEPDAGATLRRGGSVTVRFARPVAATSHTAASHTISAAASHATSYPGLTANPAQVAGDPPGGGR